MLVEDDYAPDFGDSYYPDFVTLVEAHHGYPATSLQWQPASANSFGWSQKPSNSELLATTGDALRVWEYASDQPTTSGGGYVGKTQGSAGAGGHRLTLRAALSGVRVALYNTSSSPLLFGFVYGLTASADLSRARLSLHPGPKVSVTTRTANASAPRFCVKFGRNRWCFPQFIQTHAGRRAPCFRVVAVFAIP